MRQSRGLLGAHHKQPPTCEVYHFNCTLFVDLLVRRGGVLVVQGLILPKSIVAGAPVQAMAIFKLATLVFNTCLFCYSEEKMNMMMPDSQSRSLASIYRCPTPARPVAISWAHSRHGLASIHSRAMSEARLRHPKRTAPGILSTYSHYRVPHGAAADILVREQNRSSHHGARARCQTTILHY